jgi:hypothetical protein
MMKMITHGCGIVKDEEVIVENVVYKLNDVEMEL